MGELADLFLMAAAFRTVLGEDAMPEPRTRRIWRRERREQIDWMERPIGPEPLMTAPPPFSREEETDPRNRGLD